MAVLSRKRPFLRSMSGCDGKRGLPRLLDRGVRLHKRHDGHGPIDPTRGYRGNTQQRRPCLRAYFGPVGPIGEIRRDITLFLSMWKRQTRRAREDAGRFRTQRSEAAFLHAALWGAGALA